MPGQIITMGEKPKSIPGKPANEIIEIDEGMTYIIKTADGATLVINPNTVVGRAPQIGNLVMDYCEECKSYKYSDKFRTRCSYRSAYICTPSTLVYFKEQPKVDETTEIVQQTNKSVITKLQEILHMR